jgi:hypothetical protein
MITIGVPAEGPDEPRIGLSPETAKKQRRSSFEPIRLGGATGWHVRLE